MSEKKRWKALRFLGYAIPVLLVVYVLSFGIASVFIFDSFEGSMPAAAVSFYAPVFWGMDESELFFDLIYRYEEFLVEYGP